MNQNILIFVVYDGIKNPVFAGQVIQPILKKLANDNSLKVYLIAFEKEHYTQETINDLIPNIKNLTFIQFKRFSVLGKITLLHSVYYLKKFLKNFSHYSIKARGPLAGWICLKAIDSKKCNSFIVQARGLIAVEYDLIFDKKNVISKFFHKIRKEFFNTIESETYNPQIYINNFIIESITPALTDYLIEHFNSKKEQIKIAFDDFPEIIDQHQKEKWRKEIRTNLRISNDCYIYCYNGSAKPWQSLDLTINFFKNELSQNKNILLLIITQDIGQFKKILIDSTINANYYIIINIKHNKIYEYLSACDAGLVFRKPHLANWISRPIKAMEYEAVGINIIHNNTVKWLIDNKGKYETTK